MQLIDEQNQKLKLNINDMRSRVDSKVNQNDFNLNFGIVEDKIETIQIFCNNAIVILNEAVSLHLPRADENN